MQLRMAPRHLYSLLRLLCMLLHHFRTFILLATVLILLSVRNLVRGSLSSFDFFVLHFAWRHRLC